MPATKLTRQEAEPALRRNNQLGLCWNPDGNYLVRAPSLLGDLGLPSGIVLMTPGLVLCGETEGLKGVHSSPGKSESTNQHSAAEAQVVGNLKGMGGRYH